MLKRYYNALKDKVLENSQRAQFILSLTSGLLALVFLPITLSTFWLETTIALTVVCLIFNILLTASNLIYGLLKKRDGKKAYMEFGLAGLWGFLVIGRTAMLIGMLIAG